MEGKQMKMALVMVMLVLGMCVELSSARALGCYDQCVVKCAVEKGRSATMVCLPKCYIKCGSINAVTPAHDYCKLGCAISTCLTGNTLESVRGNKVEKCVNSVCAEKCNN
ncbi:hypothetical protein MKX03_036008 [Papaver bracteatum]|nr:hypothetical protein MKX03_036008 [Papaver bracteatum]